MTIEGASVFVVTSPRARSRGSNNTFISRNPAVFFELTTQKTYRPKAKEIKQQWHLVNLEGQTLGRAATKIADILRGKHKATYTPNMDTGDFVVAINAEKITLTGKKWDDKTYHRHSGYPGGLKSQSAKALKERHPDALLIKAVKGMLPKNFLSAQLIKKLKVYAGSQHPHLAQKPQSLDVARDKELPR